MKKLILILLFIPLVSFGQLVNDDSTGYSNVYEVEMSKKEIHQKLNEWIGFTYNSANDVVQLNTEDKIIVKGSVPINFEFYKRVFEIGVRHTLSFSIRDNKYKIDFIPNSAYQTINGKDLMNSNFLNKFIRKEPLLNDNIFYAIQVQAIKEELLKSGLGYNEKNATKAADRRTKKDIQIMYRRYANNQRTWNNSMKILFENIANYINSKDDNW